MEDRIEKGESHAADREEIFSKAVRAGKRTYFFDVKSTKGNDYYVTITESKKRFSDDGKFFYEKHKLFLYKEDFEKFAEGLMDTINHIKTIAPSNGTPESNHREREYETSDEKKESFSDISFEDLGTK